MADVIAKLTRTAEGLGRQSAQHGRLTQAIGRIHGGQLFQAILCARGQLKAE